MNRLSNIGNLLKKIYRQYTNELMDLLENRGFTDLRPSFLDILMYVCDVDNPTIKQIGHHCGLKKQTMTSHLNELEKRGYITRSVGETDKREFRVSLTEYGQKFKVALLQVLEDVDGGYALIIGDVELDRIELSLNSFHQKISDRVK